MASQKCACRWYFSKSDGSTRILENDAFDFCEKERLGRGRTARSDMQSCHTAHISAQSRGWLAKPRRIRRARTNGRQRAGRYLPDEDCRGLTLSEGMMFLRFPMEKTREGTGIRSWRCSSVGARRMKFLRFLLEKTSELTRIRSWRRSSMGASSCVSQRKRQGKAPHAAPAPFPFLCSM